MTQPGQKFICANPDCGREYEKTKHQIGAGTGEFHSIICANKARATDEGTRFEKYAHGLGAEPRPVETYGHIGPCTLWTGTIDKDGYGVFALRSGDQGRAHVYAWVQANGPVPAGLVIRHHCDVRNCIRLDHIESGTPPQNVDDAMVRDRLSKGEIHPNAKLTDEIVRVARLRYAAGGVSQQQLADEYGVSQWTMGAAIRGKHWRHVS